MRNAKDGVALASIVAKETTSGQWSGTGGGLGLGTGGVGFFIGGMSGTKHEQTQRAKEFEAPAKPTFNWKYVFGPLMAILGIGILVGFSSRFTMFLTEDFQSEPNENLTGHMQENLSQIVSVLGTFVPILAVFGAVIWFIFFRSSREKEETARFEAAKAKNKIREKIYYRLRYVESDHIVFDPETMEEVPAHRDAILELINSIASKTSS